MAGQVACGGAIFRFSTKNGLRGMPRSPPSSAPGIWTNPSAIETSPLLGADHAQICGAGKIAGQNITCVPSGNPVFLKTAAPLTRPNLVKLDNYLIFKDKY